jgi:hypothetical protein
MGNRLFALIEANECDPIHPLMACFPDQGEAVWTHGFGLIP